MALIYRTTSLTEVYANSGYWADIQDAVNQCGTNGGTVHVPEGIFNFHEPGEAWTDVQVPAGVDIIGEPPSDYDEWGIPRQWGTVLVQPAYVSGTNADSKVAWFSFGTASWGSHGFTKGCRFANIKLVGYATAFAAAHPGAEYTTSDCVYQYAIALAGLKDWRIDHCCFENVFAPVVVPVWYDWNLYCCGVIDHSRLYNTIGLDDLVQYHNSTIGYGVELHRAYSGVTFDPTMNVLGHYTNYTTFIENCYFSRFRHLVSSGHGAFYVFRHNIVDKDQGHYSIDIHGVRDTGSEATGGRGHEVYENTFQNCFDFHGLFQVGGGCGAWFNNTIDSTYNAAVLYAEDYVANITWHVKDFYLWAAKGTGGSSVFVNTSGMGADRNIAVNWARTAYDPTNPAYPNPDSTWSIAGYIPYPYPHPLVSGETPPPPTQYQTPFLGNLAEGTYVITVPTDVTAGSNTYIFKHWEDGSTNPTRQITLNQDLFLLATYELYQPPPTAINLAIIAGAGGSVSPSGSQTLTIGQVYQITATPNSNYRLDHWDLSGTNLGSSNPLSLTATLDMNGKTLTAYFVLATITLTVTAEVNGTVSPSGTTTYNVGQSYQFAAIPNSGYQFDHWDLSGANQGSSNPLSLIVTTTMNAKTLTAIFTAIPPQQITLNITTTGNGSVNLTNGPHTFNVGDNITFTATPNSDSAFKQWTLDGVIYTGNPVTIQITTSMNGQTLTAVFQLTSINLTVTSGVDGSVSPSGTLILTIGQQYLFLATPTTGYQLDHWDLGGANIGSNNPINITATEDMNNKTLTSIFTLIPPVQVTINIVITGKGVTTPTSGSQIFNVGDSIQFTAVPNAGYSFTQWKLDGTIYTDNPLTFMITEDMNGKTLTAEFTGPPTPITSAILPAGIAIISVAGLVYYLATRKKR